MSLSTRYVAVVRVVSLNRGFMVEKAQRCGKPTYSSAILTIWSSRPTVIIKFNCIFWMWLHKIHILNPSTSRFGFLDVLLKIILILDLKYYYNCRTQCFIWSGPIIPVYGICVIWKPKISFTMYLSWSKICLTT